jgi:hypothetical protein
MERSKVIYDNYVLFENGVVLSLKTNRFVDGNFSNKWYIRIGLNGKVYKMHRLLAEAFIDNPNGFTCVDHIDRNKLNNDLSNLRWCSQSQNVQNSSKRKDNTTGEIGIMKCTQKGKPYWQVQVQLDGKRHNRFFNRDSDTIPQEVIDARDKLKLELHGDFACISNRSA